MPVINTGTGEQSPEPFRMAAATYLDMGLSIFPCAGEDGKKPCIKWGSLQKRRIGSKGLDKWLADFPSANIGIVTGKLSGITVIDCDNPDITPMELCATYGETPLIAKTPSGGTHLYYKFNGERSATGIALKIDIRGAGGYIIAPPSYNRKTGAYYHFIEGGIWDIGNLPVIKNNSVIQWKYNGKQRKYNEGERNQQLFDYLLKKAKSCCNLDVLNEIAEVFNNTHLIPPLDITEVHATAASIWHYKARGTLASAGEQFITLSMQKLKPIMYAHPKAFVLYVDLWSCHHGVNDTFAIAAKGYARRCGWSANTIRQEIQTLLLFGLIKRVYEGGQHPHDPAKYKFL